MSDKFYNSPSEEELENWDGDAYAHFELVAEHEAAKKKIVALEADLAVALEALRVEMTMARDENHPATYARLAQVIDRIGGCRWCVQEFPLSEDGRSHWIDGVGDVGCEKGEEMDDIVKMADGGSYPPIETEFDRAIELAHEQEGRIAVLEDAGRELLALARAAYEDRSWAINVEDLERWARILGVGR